MKSNEILQKEFAGELTDNILNYWVTKVYDPRRKMFYGLIGPDEKADPEAPLGCVMVSRILWTFSAAWKHYPTVLYRNMADEAWRILNSHFLDKEYDGYFWEVKPDGTPVDDSKQFYAQSFVIYALAEYARIFNHQESRDKAVGLFHLLEKHAFYPVDGGYFEAAEVLGDHLLTEKLVPMILAMAGAVGSEAVDSSGGLYNEEDKGHLDKDYHWWPQAEAVVGFWNSWQLTGKSDFRRKSEGSWKFIRQYQRDESHGEWHWLITPVLEVSPMVKVSPWKCPYHNGRMCLEMMRRLR